MLSKSIHQYIQAPYLLGLNYNRISVLWSYWFPAALRVIMRQLFLALRVCSSSWFFLFWAVWMQIPGGGADWLLMKLLVERIASLWFGKHWNISSMERELAGLGFRKKKLKPRAGFPIQWDSTLLAIYIYILVDRKFDRASKSCCSFMLPVLSLLIILGKSSAFCFLFLYLAHQL